MIILHVAKMNMTRANGPRYSVPGIITEQNKIDNIDVGLMHIGNQETLLKKEYSQYDFPFFYDFKKINNLPKPFNKPDLVIFQGLYNYKYKQLIKKNKIPYIIVPRVQMTKGAQDQNRLKKKIANKLYFEKFINDAAAIHFLTNQEKKDSFHYFKETQSFVLGNGTKLPDLKELHFTDKNCFTFIGRYDIHHKGLDILLKAVSINADKLRSLGAVFNLYGSEYKNGVEQLRKLISEYNISDLCKIKGAVYGKEKENVLMNSKFFIAPSRFEGHPQSVIEALAYGVPCILTPGTNMIDILTKYNAGWASDSNPENLSEKIIEAILSKNIERKSIEARKLVKENYEWKFISEATINNYKEYIRN